MIKTASMEYISHYDSPLGGITLTGCEDGLTGLLFDGEKYFEETIDGTLEERDLPVFAETKRWLDIYFSGKDPEFLPELCLRETPFRKEVCEIMLTIPYGQTMTYGQIANQLAKNRGLAKMSAQAIGGAVGHNPISLIIPCHRVIGSNGSLTGYAGGIDKKVKLLELEGVDMSGMFIPTHGTAL